MASPHRCEELPSPSPAISRKVGDDIAARTTAGMWIWPADRTMNFELSSHRRATRIRQHQAPCRSHRPGTKSEECSEACTNSCKLQDRDQVRRCSVVKLAP